MKKNPQRLQWQWPVALLVETSFKPASGTWDLGAKCSLLSRTPWTIHLPDLEAWEQPLGGSPGGRRKELRYEFHPFKPCWGLFTLLRRNTASFPIFFPLKVRARFITPLWWFMVPLNGPEFQIANTENVNPACLIWSLKYSCDVTKWWLIKYFHLIRKR